MILIFLSWLLLLFCFSVSGIAAGSLLRINSGNPFFTILTGMVAQTVLLTVCAFFIPVGFGAFLGNMALTAMLFFIFRKKTIAHFLILYAQIKSYEKTSKLILCLILVSALWKCAQQPFILDNESYYVQTIKWLNEYGLVKGLANLNVAFGQASPWHILQSGFNFSFWTNRINDLNGFLLVAYSFFCLRENDLSRKNGNGFHWLGLGVVFNALLFQFIDAPSPDFPLIIIGQVVFWLFLKSGKTTPDLKLLPLLALYLVFIKITFLPFILLAVFAGFRRRKAFLFMTASGLFLGILWVSKNLVLSGYPFFPFRLFALDTDWTIPGKLLQSLSNMVRNHEFLGFRGYKSFTLLEKFRAWIGFGGIDSVFNKGIILLFILALFTEKWRSQKQFRILYFVLLAHFTVVFCVSPQFRFFLPEFMFLSVVLMGEIVNRTGIGIKSINGILVFFAVLPIFTSYFIDLKMLTSNKLIGQSACAKWTQLYEPEMNSRFARIGFEAFTQGNLRYYSPRPNFFFYGTADGPLPCTNTKIINRFRKKYGFVPQMRSGDLKDGFYSKKTKDGL